MWDISSADRSSSGDRESGIIIVSTILFRERGPMWQIKSISSGRGRQFILYPDTEVKYYADPDDPWEYAWAGFMGTDAAVMVRATDLRENGR